MAAASDCQCFRSPLLREPGVALLGGGLGRGGGRLGGGGVLRHGLAGGKDRQRHGGDLGAMSLDDFIARMQKDIDEKVND